jgi:curved DNA-binding protein CbpA
MRREDALEILGVAHNADDRTITRAFRSLAQKHHPGAFPLRVPRSISAPIRSRDRDLTEPVALLHTSPDLLTDKNIGNEQEATVTFTRINDAYQRLTAEPEDVELFTEYDEYEFPDLGPDFFFAFEGLGAGKGNAAAEFFRRCWNDLRSYTDDEFERTYHDYTNQRGRKGRRGAPKAEPRTNTGSRGRRKSAKAPADKKKAPEKKASRRARRRTTRRPTRGARARGYSRLFPLAPRWCAAIRPR